VNYSYTPDSWWWAAEYEDPASVPVQIHPLVFGGLDSVVIRSNAILTEALRWAKTLPGWEGRNGQTVFRFIRR